MWRVRLRVQTPRHPTWQSGLPAGRGDTVVLSRHGATTEVINAPRAEGSAVRRSVHAAKYSKPRWMDGVHGNYSWWCSRLRRLPPCGVSRRGPLAGTAASGACMPRQTAPIAIARRHQLLRQCQADSVVSYPRLVVSSCHASAACVSGFHAGKF